MTLQRILGAAALTLVITAASAAAMTDANEAKPTPDATQMAHGGVADPSETPIEPGG